MHRDVRDVAVADNSTTGQLAFPWGHMARRKVWFVESWLEFRPYGVHLLTDLLIFLTIWGILWVVHAVSVSMPVDGDVANFLVGVHEIVLALNYVLLALLAVVDVYDLKRKARDEHELSAHVRRRAEPRA